MRITLILMLLSISGSLSAQSDSSLLSTYKGGFIQIHGGYIRNNSYDFRYTLNSAGNQVNGAYSYPLGGEYFDISDVNLGYTAGMGFMTIFERGIMLGLSMDYSFITQKQNEFAKISLHGASAQINLGKIILNKKSFIIYPHIGGGYFKYFMPVKNVNSKALIKLDHQGILEPGQTQLYHSHHPLFELGITIKKRIAKTFTVGLDVGGYLSTTRHDFWRKNGKVIAERPAPSLNGFYAKLTIDICKLGRKSYIVDTGRVRLKVDTTSIIKKDSVPAAKADSSSIKKKESKKKKKKEEKKAPINYNELYFKFGKGTPTPPVPGAAGRDTTNKSVIPAEEKKPETDSPH